MWFLTHICISKIFPFLHKINPSDFPRSRRSTRGILSLSSHRSSNNSNRSIYDNNVREVYIFLIIIVFNHLKWNCTCVLINRNFPDGTGYTTYIYPNARYIMSPDHSGNESNIRKPGVPILYSINAQTHPDDKRLCVRLNVEMAEKKKRKEQHCGLMCIKKRTESKFALFSVCIRSVIQYARVQ